MQLGLRFDMFSGASCRVGGGGPNGGARCALLKSTSTSLQTNDENEAELGAICEGCDGGLIWKCQAIECCEFLQVQKQTGHGIKAHRCVALLFMNFQVVTAEASEVFTKAPCLTHGVGGQPSSNLNNPTSKCFLYASHMIWS